MQPIDLTAPDAVRIASRWFVADFPCERALRRPLDATTPVTNKDTSA